MSGLNILPEEECPLQEILLTQEACLEALHQQREEVDFMRQEIEELKDRLEQLPSEAQMLEPTLSLLFESMDSVFLLLQASRQVSDTIFSIVPAKSAFWNLRKPSWRSHLENILSGYAAGIETAQEKLSASLLRLEVSLINPEQGAPFQPHLHRAITTVPGGRPGTVASVIRYGYSKQGQVIRYADVSVYKPS